MSDILLGALIGAGAVLAANLLQLLSSWQSSKRADANWRRDQRRDAYAELVQAADDYRKAAHDLYVTSVLQGNVISTVPTYLDRTLAFEEKSHVLDRAASRANLLGSRKIQGRVDALALHALRSMSDAAAADPKVSLEDWGQITKKFFDLYDAFLNAARQDLGFEALPPPAALGGPTARPSQP